MSIMLGVRKRGKRPGFTLIELVIVMTIMGVIALIAIPRMVDLGQSARESSAKGVLSTIRSILAIEYARTAAETGQASFPNQILATQFANNQLPVNALNGLNGINALAGGEPTPSGTATSTAHGFWYRIDTGVAGAYSDGTSNTSGW